MDDANKVVIQCHDEFLYNDQFIKCMGKWEAAKIMGNLGYSP